ncbi:MAG: alpha/beta hydrolase [Deltaproteobacteria bacterium]|nr:alpha/beta hydrolase [Deltaproteobacteria bacterium]
MPRPKRIPRGSFIDLGYFEAPGFGAGRRVRAYAPHGHVHSAPRPVLWLFDGQNVFEDEGSFAGGWHAHEVLDRFAVLRKAAAPVLVGIDHGGEQRIDELTPWKDAKKGGRADEFLGWVVETLMPLVRRSVGLREDVASNVVGGSSLGGLAAFYAHLRFPQAFGGALSMSPSFWFAKRRIFEFVESQPVPWTTRVYLDGGAREARGMLLKHGREMADLLAKKGWPGDSVMWRPDSKGTHAERHWRRRLPKALRFLFR